LFGDGASAFILRSAAGNDSNEGYRLGEFLFGCAGQYAAAIQVSDTKDGGLTVQFDGEALSRAAITRMEKVVASVELRSGIRAAPSAVLRRTNRTLASWPCSQAVRRFPQHFPPVAQVSGNLGRPRAARPCMKLCEVLRSKHATIAGRFFLPRSVPASCSVRLAYSTRLSFLSYFMIRAETKTRAPHSQPSRRKTQYDEAIAREEKPNTKYQIPKTKN